MVIGLGTVTTEPRNATSQEHKWFATLKDRLIKLHAYRKFAGFGNLVKNLL